MRWFKHFTDNHRGKSINFLLDEHGHFGPCGYWILMEICAEKLERKSVGSSTADDCVFSIHRRAVESALRSRPTAIQRLLGSCQAANLLEFEIVGEFYKIKVPMLLDLLDYDSKKSRTRRAEVAQTSRLYSESYSESDTDTDTYIPKTKKKPPNPLNSEVWESYKSAFNLRYKHDPVRNAKVNTAISQIATRLGRDAIEVVKFYLKHQDSFYLKKTHNISLCLQDCETLATQWKRGRAITTSDVREFEKTAHFASQVERIQNGEV